MAVRVEPASSMVVDETPAPERTRGKKGASKHTSPVGDVSVASADLSMTAARATRAKTGSQSHNASTASTADVSMTAARTTRAKTDLSLLDASALATVPATAARTTRGKTTASRDVSLASATAALAALDATLDATLASVDDSYVTSKSSPVVELATAKQAPRGAKTKANTSKGGDAKRRKMDESSGSLNSSLNDTSSSFFSTSSKAASPAQDSSTPVSHVIASKTAQALESPRMGEVEAVATGLALPPTKMQLSTPMRQTTIDMTGSTVKKLDAARAPQLDDSPMQLIAKSTEIVAPVVAAAGTEPVVKVNKQGKVPPPIVPRTPKPADATLAKTAVQPEHKAEPIAVCDAAALLRSLTARQAPIPSHIQTTQSTAPRTPSSLKKTFTAKRSLSPKPQLAGPFIATRATLTTAQTSCRWRAAILSRASPRHRSCPSHRSSLPRSSRPW